MSKMRGYLQALMCKTKNLGTDKADRHAVEEGRQTSFYELLELSNRMYLHTYNSSARFSLDAFYSLH